MTDMPHHKRKTRKRPSAEQVIEYVKKHTNGVGGYKLSEDFKKDGYDPFATQTVVQNVMERGQLSFDQQYQLRVGSHHQVAG